jgi:hypothetical protein
VPAAVDRRAPTGFLPMPCPSGALIVFAAVLETLQALTPDRWANPWAAFACGVLAAALIAYVSIRAWTRFHQTASDL